MQRAFIAGTREARSSLLLVGVGLSLEEVIKLPILPVVPVGGQGC